LRLVWGVFDDTQMLKLQGGAVLRESMPDFSLA